MADAVEAVVRWRMPIFGWVAIALAVLAVLFIFWLTSARDLAVVDAKAKGLGIALTWAERGLRASPSDRLADWRRLGQLSGALQSYQDATDWRFRPDQPLPAELAQHHASLPAADLAELQALCDGLPADGLVLRTAFNFDTLLPEIEWVRNCSRLHRERILLARPEDLASESVRMLTVITARRPQLSLIEHLVSINCLGLWVQAVAWRLEHGISGREVLAAQADRIRQWLATDMHRALDCEFLVWRTLIGEVHSGRAKAIADVESALGLGRGFGMARTFMRAARGESLDLLLDAAHGWSAASGYPARSAAVEAISVRFHAMPDWSPAKRLLGLAMSANSLINDAWMKTDTALLLLAADLRGQPWPADPTDPKGLPIRRIERGGRLIGGYLLGKDARDDGGRINRDLCIQLYDRLGAIMAADQPKDP